MIFNLEHKLNQKRDLVQDVCMDGHNHGNSRRQNLQKWTQIKLKATIQCSFSKTLFEKGTLELNWQNLYSASIGQILKL